MGLYDIFKVEKIDDLAHKNVYYFLKRQSFSEHFIRKLRKVKNAILLNDSPATTKTEIKENDIIQTLKNPDQASQIPECDGNLDIVFEDDDFLIVNKPHNLACIPTRSHINDNLGGQVMRYMKAKDKNFVLRIAGRLDKETAGIVIVAKNVAAFNNLHDIKKKYYALCTGAANQKDFVIDKKILTISHNGINQMQRIISDHGKEAVTHVHIEKQGKDFFLASFVLETGRTHQIRVHMASENHPLLGDQIYSSNKTSNHAFLMLKEVSFTHFRSNRPISISLDFPEDWKSLLKKLT